MFEATSENKLYGTVAAVSAEFRHRFSKPVQSHITLIRNHGVEGDAHAGEFVRHRYIARRHPRLANNRQVHLIPEELFGLLHDAGYEVGPGDLGENITTAGLDLEALPLETRISLGPEAVVELTGLRAPCVLIDKFKAGLKRHVLSSPQSEPPFRCGVLGVVRTGGRVSAGDRATVQLPEGAQRALPKL
ncbi:MOSC domain-containing protein [Bradyrhizobium sp.]|uniref:MOSC domain-containing protein n=1 Tax=Bradyrhizobium sp. TaxID=376 RepID=UPI0039E5B0C7